MTKPQFVYVIYIRATADEVWSGLVDPEWTRKYWMHDNISDWKPGSPWTPATDLAGTVDIAPGHRERRPRLVDSLAAGGCRQPVKTRVSFELAPKNGPGRAMGRLTVAHTGSSPTPRCSTRQLRLAGLMSGLKTMLERRSFEKNP